MQNRQDEHRGRMVRPQRKNKRGRSIHCQQRVLNHERHQEDAEEWNVQEDELG